MEGRERVTSEEGLLGVEVSRLEAAEPIWQIFIRAAEFVRKDPLESRLENAITIALKKVKGVKTVARQDRDVWLVHGNARGEDLVTGCSIALD